MKLTDEKVARALGLTYQPKEGPYTKATWWRKNHVAYTGKLPAFTTSLDAIVAEIEARGLAWQLSMRSIGGYRANLFGPVKTLKTATAHEATAPLALCAALLSFFGDRPCLETAMRRL